MLAGFSYMVIRGRQTTSIFAKFSQAPDNKKTTGSFGYMDTGSSEKEGYAVFGRTEKVRLRRDESHEN